MFLFSQFVEELLKSRGLSQKELAARLAVSPQYISQILKDQAVPSDEILLTLEQIAGLPPRYLVNHKTINRIEVGKADLSFLMDEEFMSWHGIVRSDNKKIPMNDDQKQALHYVKNQDWQGMIAWAVGKLAKSTEAKGKK